MTTALDRPRDLPPTLTMTATAAAPRTTTSILLADGHHLFRSGLSALLDREPDLTVSAEACDAESAVTQAGGSRPDVAVVDLDVPGAGGLRTAELIRSHSPRTAVLLLGTAPRADEVQRAYADGVNGMLRKDVRPERLITTVRELAAGRRVFDPELVLVAIRPGPGTPTRRELAVLRLVAAGSTIHEVAGQLSLSPGTVRNYVSSAIARTGARNRCDAIRIARENDWL